MFWACFGCPQDGKLARAADDYLQQAAVLVARIDRECGGTEGNAACHPAVVYVATDSGDAVRLARAWETGQNRLPSFGFAPGRRVRVVAASDTETQVRGLSLSLSLSLHLSLSLGLSLSAFLLVIYLVSLLPYHSSFLSLDFVHALSVWVSFLGQRNACS